MEFRNRRYYDEDDTERTREEFWFIDIPEIIKYDDRGVDVGMLRQNGYTIKAIRSHIHDRKIACQSNLFPCLKYAVTLVIVSFYFFAVDLCPYHRAFHDLDLPNKMRLDLHRIEKSMSLKKHL